MPYLITQGIGLYYPVSVSLCPLVTPCHLLIEHKEVREQSCRFVVFIFEISSVERCVIRQVGEHTESLGHILQCLEVVYAACCGACRGCSTVAHVC